MCPIEKATRRLAALEGHYHLAPSAGRGARNALRWARKARRDGVANWYVFVSLAWSAMERASKGSAGRLDRRAPRVKTPSGLGETPDLWYARLMGDHNWIEV